MIAARRLAAARRLLSTAAGAPASGISFGLTPDQVALQATARRFAAEAVIPAAPALDKSGEYPEQLFCQAWELGLVNIHIPKQYGGAGRHALDGVIVAEELSYACPGVLTAIEINTVAEVPVLLAGTEAQKNKYLRMMTAEPVRAAYCVTEPDAGSDVAGLKTRAEKKGDEWIINGSKMWITNAGMARWYFLLARTDFDPATPTGKAFTAFLVDRDTPGITVGKKERMLGQRCSDTRGITFEDVRVPAGAVLGKPGQGFRIAMGAFDLTRPPVAASALGITRRALDEMVTRVVEGRKAAAAGSPIMTDADLQEAHTWIADVSTSLEAARLLTYRAAALADSGVSNTREAAMAKLFAGELCNVAVDRASRTFGYDGLNEAYVAAKLVRDARILTIYEGTSQIQKLIISRDMIENALRTRMS